MKYRTLLGKTPIPEPRKMRRSFNESPEMQTKIRFNSFLPMTIALLLFALCKPFYNPGNL